MNENLLPEELKEQYEQKENVFELWHIEKEKENTVFYVLGHFVFQIQGDLTPKQIIEQMNNFEFIYSTAFRKGVEYNQEKIKSALGM